MNLGDIYFTFRGESKQLEADAKKSGDKAADQAGKSFKDRFKGAIKGANLGQTLTTGFGLGAGLGVFGLVTSALSSVVAMAGEAQQAASDLEEQQAKLGQVFGASAGEIREWADDAATSMGLSERAALEATGTLGNFLQAMGTAEAPAADMSMGIVQLSADIASFNNVGGGAEEVLEAMRAGLSGETEPLRRYGIDISDAAVQTELLAQGIQKVGGNFTQGQKIQARYAIILRQTTKAQGDYARTATSSANQERTLAALREDALATFGKYIDNVLKLGQSLAIEFVKGVEAAGDALNDLNRILFPSEAMWQDTQEAILAQAEAMGLNTKAVLEFAKAEREQAAAQREATDDLADYGIRIVGMTSIHTSQVEATDEATEAIEENSEAVTNASGIVERFNALSDVEREQLAKVAEETTELTDATKTTTAAKKKLTLATYDASAASDLVTQKFGKERESLRDLIRATNRLAGDRDKTLPRALSLLDQVERAERKQAQAAIDGRADVVASYQAQIDKIQGMLGPLRAAIVLTSRLQAQAALQPAFDAVVGIFGGKKPERRHSGGSVERGLAYLVGAPRSEELFLPNVSGRVVDHQTTSEIVSGGGGDTYNIPVTVHGSPNRPATPMETARQLRRAARFGIAPPRRTGWAT